jgi:hypothetical protein
MVAEGKKIAEIVLQGAFKFVFPMQTHIPVCVACLNFARHFVLPIESFFEHGNNKLHHIINIWLTIEGFAKLGDLPKSFGKAYSTIVFRKLDRAHYTFLLLNDHPSVELHESLLSHKHIFERTFEGNNGKVDFLNDGCFCYRITI